MRTIALVIEDEHGMTRCENCGAELVCNDCGDMPSVCPSCGAELDYELYEPENQCPPDEEDEC